MPGRKDLEAEVAEELDFHLAMHARDLEARGRAPEAARAEAAAAFGDRRRIETACRHIRGGPTVGGVFRSAGPLAALALGTAGLLSVLLLADATLLRPGAGRVGGGLHEIRTVYDGSGIAGASAADARDWSATGLFDGLALSFTDSLSLQAGEGPVATIRATSFTPGYFRLLGETPLLGQVASVPGRGVVLSHELWSTRFGADPAVLGRGVSLAGVPHTVIGVLRPFARRWPADVWVPTPLDAFPEGRSRRGNRVVARLADGVGLERAHRELAAVSRELAARHPATNAFWEASIVPVAEQDAPGLRAAWTVVLILAAALVLGSPGAARGGGARARELLALDAAARGRPLRRHAVTHGLLPALAGVAGGTWLAIRGTRALLGAALPASAQLYPVALDLRTLGLVAVAGGALGVWLLAARSRVGRAWWMVPTAAIVVLLAIGAGLLRASSGAGRDALGFEPADFTTARLETPETTTPAERRRFFGEVVAVLERDPRVGRVALTESVPPASDVLFYSVHREGDRIDPSERQPGMYRISVEPAYFGLMGFRLLAGRGIGSSDGPDAEPVAVLSRTAAHRLWPHERAIGARFRVGGGDPWYRVVGIVEDIPERGADAQVPVAYLSFAQAPPARAFVVAETPDAEAAREAIAAAVASVDPSVPADRIGTVAEVIGARRAAVRGLGVATALAGLLALLLVTAASMRWTLRDVAPVLAGGWIAGAVLLRVAAPALEVLGGASALAGPVPHLVAAPIMLLAIAAGRMGWRLVERAEA